MQSHDFYQAARWRSTLDRLRHPLGSRGRRLVVRAGSPSGLTCDGCGQGSGVMGLMWMSQTKSKASSTLPLSQIWSS